MAVRKRQRTPVPPPPEREVLNIDEAAALLGVSVKTFAKVLREEDVPGRKVGREWKFSRRALVDWVGTAHARAFVDGIEDRGLPVRARRRARSSGSGRTGGRGAGPRAARPPDGFSVDDL